MSNSRENRVGELWDKFMMDYNLFEMQMNRLAITLGVEISEKRVKEYYQKLNYISDDKFAKVVENLQDYEKPYNFPLPADFKNTYFALFPPYNAYEDTKQQLADAPDPNFAKRVLWCFMTMNEIKKDTVFDMINPWTGRKFGNDWNEYRKQANAIVHKIYREMVSKGMVYSCETKKWVLKANAIGSGAYWNPAEWGNW